MSNVYACKGLSEKVSDEVQVHYFLTKDDSHDKIEEIHSCLKVLLKYLTMAGYVPDTNFMLHNVEEEQKQKWASVP